MESNINYNPSVTSVATSPLGGTWGAADYKKGQPRWCPGCGDHFFLASLHKALAEIGVPPYETAVISGIGCSSRLPHYMATYGMNTIHGRAAAIADSIPQPVHVDSSPSRALTARWKTHSVLLNSASVLVGISSHVPLPRMLLAPLKSSRLLTITKVLPFAKSCRTVSSSTMARTTMCILLQTVRRTPSTSSMANQ